MTRLGILDWGIGGLDVVRKLRSAQVHTPVLYLSDAGEVPYGKQTDDALAARVSHVVETFARHGCTQVVLGCNAASTVLHHERVQQVARLERVLGVIEPAIAAVLDMGLPEVVVIGGARTIESGAYAKPLSAAGVRVRVRVAQPLSALIEAGVLHGPELERCIEAIVGPVSDGLALLSACTHYLAVEPALRRAMPQLRTIVDPTAELVARHFTAADPTPQRDVYWTTGDPMASSRSAKAAFGLDVHFESAPASFVS